MVPNASELLWLRHGLGVSQPEFQSMKLFVNDFTPDEDTVLGDFVEASGGGYSDVQMDRALWTFATQLSGPGAGRGFATYPRDDLAFTFTGPLDGAALIRGWYIVKRTAGGLIIDLIELKKFPTPITPIVGWTLKVSMSLRIRSEN